MSIIDTARKRLINALTGQSVKAGKIHPFDFSSFEMSGQPVYTEMTVTKSVREGYKRSLYVYRSIRTIVQSVSGVPWIVVDRETGEEVKDHAFTKAWANPNPEFSGQDNMEFIVAHLKLVGNALISPVLLRGVPVEFWMCMPDMLHPIPSKKKGEWIEGYELITGDGDMKILPPEMFIHFMQFDPGNPYWGIGDLQAAARTIDTDNEAQDTQKLQLQNRNVPPGVFQFEAKMTPEQHAEATRSVKEKFL